MEKVTLTEAPEITETGYQVYYTESGRRVVVIEFDKFLDVEEELAVNDFFDDPYKIKNGE